MRVVPIFGLPPWGTRSPNWYCDQYSNADNSRARACMSDLLRGGAFVHCALQLAASGRFRNIVTVLGDTGERYVSTGMWKAGAAESVN